MKNQLELAIRIVNHQNKLKGYLETNITFLNLKAKNPNHKVVRFHDFAEYEKHIKSLKRRILVLDNLLFDITSEISKYYESKIPKETNITINHIIEVVSKYFNMTQDMMLSKTRKREFVQARQIAMYFARNITKKSRRAIGEQIGGKDHATVFFACKTVNNLIDTDKVFRNYITKINEIL